MKSPSISQFGERGGHSTLKLLKLSQKLHGWNAAMNLTAGPFAIIQNNYQQSVEFCRSKRRPPIRRRESDVVRLKNGPRKEIIGQWECSCVGLNTFCFKFCGDIVKYRKYMIAVFGSTSIVSWCHEARSNPWISILSLRHRTTLHMSSFRAPEPYGQWHDDSGHSHENFASLQRSFRK